MEIVHIFVDKNGEGLHAVSFADEENEFSKLFELWNEPDYILNYCKKHQDKIFGYFGIGKIENFVEHVYSEVEALEDIFADFQLNHLGKNNKFLQALFAPLSKKELFTKELQLTKAKVDRSKFFPVPVLRVYALMVNETTFIVTGGCIKFSQEMQNTETCNDELEKLKSIREELKERGIIKDDDLIYYYESRG